MHANNWNYGNSSGMQDYIAPGSYQRGSITTQQNYTPYNVTRSSVTYNATQPQRASIIRHENISSAGTNIFNTGFPGPNTVTYRDTISTQNPLVSNSQGPTVWAGSYNNWETPDLQPSMLRKLKPNSHLATSAFPNLPTGLNEYSTTNSPYISNVPVGGGLPHNYEMPGQLDSPFTVTPHDPSTWGLAGRSNATFGYGSFQEYSRTVAGLATSGHAYGRGEFSTGGTFPMSMTPHMGFVGESTVDTFPIRPLPMAPVMKNKIARKVQKCKK